MKAAHADCLGRRSRRLLPPLVLLAATVLGAAPPSSAETAPCASIVDAYRLPEDPSELLRLDDEMRRYFAARVPRHGPIERRLAALSAAIVRPDGLGFRYDNAGLYDVREAFRRRSGNCLTFAALFVAVARDCGLRARFNQVDVRPTWSRVGNIVLETRHVAVRIEHDDHTYEVDLDLPGMPAPPRIAAGPVSDFRAFAEIYGHAGVQRLASGDPTGALPLLRRATITDASSTVAWTNLGKAYLICGDIAAARAAFEHALRLHASDLAAIDGLARVLRSEGHPAVAARLERRAARYRERNPYYLLSLAEGALAENKTAQARRLLLRAYAIKRDEPAILAALAEIALQLGRQAEATRWQRRLRSLRHPPEGRGE